MNRLRKEIFLLFILLSWNEADAQFTIDYSYPPTATLPSNVVPELSGIIPAGNIGEYWCHSDSGSDAVIYRINQQGTVLQKVKLTGVPLVDWEAITKDENGYLYIGDIGDNNASRDVYAIYKFLEPLPDAEAVETQAFSFQYEGKQPHDAESIFWMEGKIYIIQKNYDGSDSIIYCLDLMDGEPILQARKVGVLNTENLFQLMKIVTDASYSPARHELAVLTYFGIILYSVTGEENLTKPYIQMKEAFLGQSEAICYVGDAWMITNEDGVLWDIPVSQVFPAVSILNWRAY